MKRGKDYIGVGCGALIVNDKNQVLLLLRTNKSQGGGGNLWSRPGGTVDFGETVEQAIKREIKEELDIDIELFGPKSYYNDIREEFREKKHWVACGCFARIIKGELKIMEPAKHEKVEWFDLDKLPENIIQYTKESIEDFRRYLNKNDLQ